MLPSQASGTHFPKWSWASFPVRIPLGLAHLCPLHQGQLYFAAQARFRACLLKCCNCGGAGLTHHFSFPHASSPNCCKWEEASCGMHHYCTLATSQQMSGGASSPSLCPGAGSPTSSVPGPARFCCPVNVQGPIDLPSAATSKQGTGTDLLLS